LKQVAGHWLFQCLQLFPEALRLKGKPERQLTDARIYRRIADEAKRRGREVRVRIRKLWMVERIEELGAKFNCAVFTGPRDCEYLCNCKIQVCLTRAIYDSCAAVSEGRPNAVGADHRWSRETGFVPHDLR
jgi:hypothetical protein